MANGGKSGREQASGGIGEIVGYRWGLQGGSEGQVGSMGERGNRWGLQGGIGEADRVHWGEGSGRLEGSMGVSPPHPLGTKG